MIKRTGPIGNRNSRKPKDPTTYEYEVRSKGEGEETIFCGFRREHADSAHGFKRPVPQPWESIGEYESFAEAQKDIDKKASFKIPSDNWQDICNEDY